MKKLKCLVIDGVKADQELIRDHIAKIPYLHLDGSFCSPLEAMPDIQENNIDLLFMDVNTPDINGIEFLRMLNPKPMVVFTTTCRDYAFEGFQLGVIDYLLKPIEFQDFFKAVSKATRQFHWLELPRKNDPAFAKAKEKDYLVIKSNRRLYRIPIPDITYIEGMKEYVAVYTGDHKKLLFLHSLKNLEDTLPHDQFIRIHKSYIIAIDKVTSMEGNQVYLGEMKLPLGERYKERFFETVFSTL